MSESFEKAVEAASLAMLGRPTLSATTVRDALRAALPHLTADDLRDTPAGRELIAEAKSAGWDDVLNELRKGQGMHRALAGTLATRKPNYEGTPAMTTPALAGRHKEEA